jgi:hypothetical protein
MMHSSLVRSRPTQAPGLVSFSRIACCALGLVVDTRDAKAQGRPTADNPDSGVTTTGRFCG